MSPDTVSSLFPDRPIRPLPKRRLRERLSPEVAQSIKYPPSTHDTAPLFHYPPYTLKEEAAGPSSAGFMSPVEQGRRPDADRSLPSLRNGVCPVAEGEDEAGLRSTLVARSPPKMLSRAARNPARPDQPRPADPQPPPSAASSVDGYDSFENTNNKKRKIPSAGDSVLNGAHSLNSEVGSLALSAGAQSPTSDANADRPHHGSSAYSTSGSYMSNQGFSGSGRGRLGRSRNGRSPLRALPDGNMAWPGRASKAGASAWPPAQEGGIISSAIANAEKLPPQGQENVSLLQQHSAAAKSTPTSTQFTFTCDSQVPGTVQWPGHPNRLDMAGQAVSMARATNGAAHDTSSKSARSKSRQTRRKSRRRRRLDEELDTAARHRRQMAAENYFNHPPRAEDVWICEFCEYERIFGDPPFTLMRDYEIKDRRHRQEEADRKRLLEKAKAKSRKGRKNGKAPSRGNHGAHHMSDQGPSDMAGDQDVPPMRHGPSYSTQSEGEEYDDEFEDDYAGLPSEHPPPTAAHPPANGDDGGESAFQASPDIVRQSGRVAKGVTDRGGKRPLRR